MRTPLRMLALIGALALAGGLLGACDGSPYAYVVDNHRVTVDQFNHQLADWSANPAFVTFLDQNSNGITVAGTGVSGTYNNSFVGFVLQEEVGTYALSQFLRSTGHSATADERIAARAVFESSLTRLGQFWASFREPVRQALIENLADQAALVPAPTDTSTLLPLYQQISTRIFSQVCVDVATSPTEAAANDIAISKDVLGATECFDQQQLEAAPPDFQNAVLSLKQPGDVSQPVREAYGFQVLQLVRRDGPGLDAGVAQVLAALQATQSPAANILAAAKVKVNPMYGTWSNGQLVPPGQSTTPTTGQ